MTEVSANQEVGNPPDLKCDPAANSLDNEECRKILEQWHANESQSTHAPGFSIEADGSIVFGPLPASETEVDPQTTPTSTRQATPGQMVPRQRIDSSPAPQDQQRDSVPADHTTGIRDNPNPPFREPNTPGVQRDEQGRVIKVVYPNGTRREFGWSDDGTLNRFVLPTGAEYRLDADGSWTPVNRNDRKSPRYSPPGDSATKEPGAAPHESGQANPQSMSSGRDYITSAKLDENGNFELATASGDKQISKADGTEIVHTAHNGATVTTDPQGRVVEVVTKNGRKISFDYVDDSHEPSRMRMGGFAIEREGERWLSNGRDTGMRNLSVHANGTFDFVDGSARRLVFNPDLTSDVINPNGSVMHRDQSNRITSIRSPLYGGEQVSIEYDDNGWMSSFTEPDGTKFTRSNEGTVDNYGQKLFVDENGNKRSNVDIDSLGTITATDQNGRVVTIYGDGYRTLTDKTQTELRDLSKKIHQNMDDKNIDEINKVVYGLSVTDRGQLLKEYSRMYWDGPGLIGGLERGDFTKWPSWVPGQSSDKELSAHARATLANAQLQGEAHMFFSNRGRQPTPQSQFLTNLQRLEATDLSDVKKAEIYALTQNRLTEPNDESPQQRIDHAFDTVAQNLPPLKLSTDHFNITMPNDGNPNPHVGSALEFGYKQLSHYTGIDLNSVTRNLRDGRSTPKFQYDFPYSDNMWWQGWEGGLTAYNHSQVNEHLLSQINPDSDGGALSLVYHELANGWAMAFTQHDGKPTNLPTWYSSEGQAGFLKSHVTIDAGYGDIAQDLHNGALTHYDKYIAQQGRQPQDKNSPEYWDEGAVTNVLLESLYQKYGWNFIREVNKQVQDGKLSFDANASPGEKNGRMIYELSKATGADLTQFFADNHIIASPKWMLEIAKLRLAKGEVPIARTLETKPHPQGEGLWGR